MDPICEHQACLTRRQFFGKSAWGIGAAALAALLNADEAKRKRIGGLPELPHFAPKAKRQSGKPGLPLSCSPFDLV